MAKCWCSGRMETCADCMAELEARWAAEDLATEMEERAHNMGRPFRPSNQSLALLAMELREQVGQTELSIRRVA